ncbi:NAD-dependent succinate-semialdehyde dehydrogenase [Mycolicibacterium goodii]|uniref:NAD-dependent succinate-semialdehyde dehydrogenase n=1 Tax=Mycolicibacterium goodii TaxID=134601 RepID=UPI0027DFC781|nr:NAD-dependent succinate-semialdehyde dehydrogenase [Mycolicibacterium goodii]
MTGLWIDGVSKPARSGKTFDVLDPASGRSIASVADGNLDDATEAVEAAARSFPGWSETAPRARSEVLQRAFQAMLDDREDLAALISNENGKSLADARSEVTYAAEFFRWYAEEAVRTDGDFGASPAGSTRTIVTHRPVGVATLVTPWNFPAAMATRKIGPALAAGCTVVLKPAGETPLTALAVASILTKAGAPAGVVNVVPSSSSAEVVEAMLSDPRVRKLSFTGSTRIGRMLLKQAAERVTNCSMELGGNAPFVVAPDADIDAAVAGAMMAKFRNGGQACTAANRFFIHSDVAEQFTEEFCRRVSTLRVGSAFENDSEIGPLINAKAVQDVATLVDGAVAAGARIAGRAPVPGTSGGFFYPPTVLADVRSDSAILNEEIFGPVAALATWRDDTELLELINGTAYGLAAYVYSRNLQWAVKLAEKMDAGMVGINRGLVSDPAAPFGGLKQSGIGREGAREGLREFQETQYFSVDWS